MAALHRTKADKIKTGEMLAGGEPGLSLLGTGAGRGKWRFRYSSPVTSARRVMGLGGYPAVDPPAARAAARDARKLVQQGVDPLDRAASRTPTLADGAEVVIAAASHRKAKLQLELLFGPTYAGPLLAKPVDKVTRQDVAKLLRPVIEEKPSTAGKLYAALRRAFGIAASRHYDRTHIALLNPVDWSALRDGEALNRPRKLSRGHHAAARPVDLPAVVSNLRTVDSVASRLVEFIALTVVRLSAARLAQFDEFELDGPQPVWRVPVERLKDKRHREEPFVVPLSPRAAEIIQELSAARTCEFVFPGRWGREPIGGTAPLRVVLAASDGACVVHGLRASFKSWTREQRLDRWTAEECLGHAIGRDVESAYDRADTIEHRREMLDAWAAFLTGGANGQ